MRRLALIALFVCLSVAAKGQSPNAAPTNSPCTLSIAQSPEIRGLRLGMAADKLLAAFPLGPHQQAIEGAIKESKKPDNYGVGRVGLQSYGSTDTPRFSGVSSIGVELLDERISSFTISYSGPQWTSVDQFIGKLSEALRLPTAERWSREAGGPNKFLKCAGFGISAFALPGSAGSIVSVRDASASQIVNDRREAAKEKERQAFKP